MNSVRHCTTGAIVLLLTLFGWPNVAAAQLYTISPSPFLLAQTNAGAIINNACIWTYTAGTLTAATTYSDSSGTPNTNPIRSDSAGRFTAYLSPGASYKFVYETACTPPSHGTTLKTADNIAAVPTSGLNVDITGTAGASVSAGDVLYLADGTGGTNAGQWYPADADNTYSSSTTGTVGVAVNAISSAGSGLIRTQGRITGLTGLSIGELYYVSATAGGLTVTPPTNARFVGHADSATSLIVEGNPGGVRMPDSDGSHQLVITTTSNLTADRLLTVVPGDAARTVTIGGNATISQDYSTTGSPTFNALTVTTCTGCAPQPFVPQGRCTLESGVPISTSDQTAKTTLYYAPYSAVGGAYLSLYNGSTAWVTYSLSQMSIAVPNTTNTVYDVFIYDNAGTPTLELTAWTSDTARATALTTQNGVYVKTGATTRLYVCTFRTTGSSGQTEDSLVKRYVWNYYNRVPRLITVKDLANTWGNSGTDWRQWNGSTANQADVVVGVAEVVIDLRFVAQILAGNGTTTGIGIGKNSTTAPVTSSFANRLDLSVVTSSSYNIGVASFREMPAIGRTYYPMLEKSNSASFVGDNGGTDWVSGMDGSIQG